MLKGKARVIWSVVRSLVCRSKYYFSESESTVISTSLILPPNYLPFSLSRLIGISWLIVAFFTGVSFSTIALFLNPLFSFGKQTTVRKEHHRMFRGKRTYMRSLRAYDISTVTLGTSLMSGLSCKLKFIKIIAIPSATEWCTLSTKTDSAGL